jgi:hypothetical protein
MVRQARQDDLVQRAVQLPIPVPVQAMAGHLTGGCGDGRRARQGREGGLGPNPA